MMSRKKHTHSHTHTHTQDPGSRITDHGSWIQGPASRNGFGGDSYFGIESTEIYDGGPCLLLPAVLDLRPLAREAYLVSLPVGAGIALKYSTHEGRLLGYRIRNICLKGTGLEDIQRYLNFGMPGLISA